MDEKQERRRRRQAIRWTLQGRPTKFILHAVRRGRTWLSKWRRRFTRSGWAGLRSQSRRPHRRPRQYPARVRAIIVRVRRQLVKRTVGLIGAAAIQRELRTERLVRPIPSRSTIQRILRQADLTGSRSAPRSVDYPAPTPTADFVLYALDWTERYLEGGAKVYAFHSLDRQTWACKQTICPDKSGASARAHALNTWENLGIPDGLQLDNDAAFCGGYKVPRVVGQFVRLALYVGIEVIFLPVGEPERNGEVEWFNGLWGGPAFWARRHFGSVAAVQRASPEFEAWYMNEYQPPALQGQTPAEAQRHVRRQRLTAAQRRALPERLPITAGRVHFIRLVEADGTIALLNESWPVSQRLTGHYVWATVWTHRHQLEIYHRRSPETRGRLVKTYRYPLHEPVVALSPPFTRSRRRRKMSAML